MCYVKSQQAPAPLPVVAPQQQKQQLQQPLAPVAPQTFNFADLSFGMYGSLWTTSTNFFFLSPSSAIIFPRKENFDLH
jgi:hypothetical protein